MKWTDLQPCRWCFQPVVTEENPAQCVACWALYQEIKRRTSIAARMLVAIAKEEERQDGL